MKMLYQPLNADAPRVASVYRSSSDSERVSRGLGAAAIAVRTAALSVDAFVAALLLVAALTIATCLVAPALALKNAAVVVADPATAICQYGLSLYLSGIVVVALLYGAPLLIGISPTEFARGPLHAVARGMWRAAQPARRERRGGSFRYAGARAEMMK